MTRLHHLSSRAVFDMAMNIVYDVLPDTLQIEDSLKATFAHRPGIFVLHVRDFSAV